jgi:hypothetical protein
MTTFQSCKSFGIDFQNLAFEIYIPRKNESQFHLLSYIQSNQIIIHRTDIIKENFRENLPMMIIDTKISNSKNKSIILIEQENDLNSIQTANVTIIFNHQVSHLIRFTSIIRILYLLTGNTEKCISVVAHHPSNICLERKCRISLSSRYNQYSSSCQSSL